MYGTHLPVSGGESGSRDNSGAKSSVRALRSVGNDAAKGIYTICLYDIADNDKPGDYKVDMPEASLFARP